GRTAGRSIRVGYRVVLAGPPEVQAILAAPQLLDDERVRQQQEDLALALVLATLAGLVAAVYLAGLAARGLARPVAALREAAAAGEFLAAPPAPAGGDTIAEREFDVGARQIRVQLAPLGPPPADGCVVALDDATALTRAARVLAWGEMARQIAHEIKNPLTPIR